MPKSKNAINTVNVTADPPLNENVKKRGRKSKKEIEEAKEKLENTISNKNTEQDNIIVSIKEECTNDIIGEVNENIDSNNLLEITDTSYPLNDTKNVGKKRGRKPKGGKIIQQILPLNNNKDIRPNIILHLKCSLKDLQNSSSIENNIESYNFSSKNNISYEIISNNDSLFQNNFNENKPIIAERCDDDDDYLVEEDDFYKKKDNETKKQKAKHKHNRLCERLEVVLPDADGGARREVEPRREVRARADAEDERRREPHGAVQVRLGAHEREEGHGRPEGPERRAHARRHVGRVHGLRHLFDRHRPADHCWQPFELGHQHRHGQCLRLRDVLHRRARVRCARPRLHCR